MFCWLPMIFIHNWKDITMATCICCYVVSSDFDIQSGGEFV